MMKFHITGTLSKHDAWALDYIRKNGPVSGCDEKVITEYAVEFKKPVTVLSRTGNLRCKAWEKKLISLWERRCLVRIKQPSPYAEREEVWHYGIPGRDKGELFTSALEEE